MSKLIKKLKSSKTTDEHKKKEKYLLLQNCLKVCDPKYLTYYVTNMRKLNKNSSLHLLQAELGVKKS